MKRSIYPFLLIAFLSFITGHGYAHRGGANLAACVAGTCLDEPMDITQLATLKAGEIIDSFYKKRQRFDGFNGCVVIAKDGKPIYTGAFGYGDLNARDTLTMHSSFQLASVAKTFTATAVLMMVERGQLSLDDTVQKFFPEFPYHGITVKMLLCHRTGLPDYTYFPKEYFGTNTCFITNSDLMQVLAKRKPQVRCRPDRMFIYCNTNYAVLASIIENISGQSFAKFMHDNIFSPLGMANSFVYNMADSATYCRTTSYESKGRVWRENLCDGIVGDKGIYASADDMLKWDNALRNNLLISAEMTEEAYKPRSLDRYSFVKEKEKNYGYGWRMTKRIDKTYLIYHNGFWHGSNNVFARDISNGYTVIVLGNKSNNNNYATYPVWDVLGQLKNFENLAEAQ